MCNFNFSPFIKSEKKRPKLILIFYLTKYIQNIIISMHNQYKNAFFILSLQNPIPILYLQHISIQISPNSSVQPPSVATGCHMDSTATENGI